MSRQQTNRHGETAVSRSMALACVGAIVVLLVASGFVLRSAFEHPETERDIIEWIDPLIIQAHTVERDVIDTDRALRLYVLEGRSRDADAFTRKYEQVTTAVETLRRLADSADPDTRQAAVAYAAEVGQWLSLTNEVFKTARSTTLDENRKAVMARMGPDDPLETLRAARQRLETSTRAARDRLVAEREAFDASFAMRMALGIALVLGAVALALWLALAASRRVAPSKPVVDLALLRTILDQVPEGIAVFEEGGKLLVLNMAAARFVKVEEDGTGSLLLIDENGAALGEEEAPLSRAFAGHHVHERQVFAERLDGSAIPVEVRAEPILDQGRTKAAVVVLRDKDEERRVESEIRAASERAATAEANLAELTRRFREAESRLAEYSASTLALQKEAEANSARFYTLVRRTESIGVSVFSVPDFQLVEANVAGLEMLGERRRDRDVRGLSLTDIIPGAAESGIQNLFQKVASSGEPYSSDEYYAQGLRHGPAYWRFSLVPIQDQQGATQELVLIGHDSSAEVEARAGAGAAGVREGDWSIEDILLAISNDLRTPIVSIQGMVTLFQQKYAEAVPDVTALHYLELTQRNAEQMIGLIDDLAELSDLARADLNVSEIPLAAVIEEAWRDGPRSGVELRVAGPLPTVRADKEKLHRAFRDIFDTALRYRRDEADAWIHIRVEEDDHYWQIQLSDNGKGLSEGEGERLFGPLAHFDGMSGNGGATLIGSGIGLAAVRQIAQSHGGAATADGTPGEGAVYTFSIAKAV